MKEQTYAKELAKLDKTAATADDMSCTSASGVKRTTFRKPLYDEKQRQRWGKPTISENSRRYERKRAHSSGNIGADLHQEGMQ